ncbi:MAG: hypothetical protein WKF50_05485 [Nocardioides sp.]
MFVVWPRELKDCRGTPDDGGVQSIGLVDQEDQAMMVMPELTREAAR